MRSDCLVPSRLEPDPHLKQALYYYDRMFKVHYNALRPKIGSYRKTMFISLYSISGISELPYKDVIEYYIISVTLITAAITPRKRRSVEVLQVGNPFIAERKTRVCSRVDFQETPCPTILLPPEPSSRASHHPPTPRSRPWRGSCNRWSLKLGLLFNRLGGLATSKDL